MIPIHDEAVAQAQAFASLLSERSITEDDIVIGVAHLVVVVACLVDDCGGDHARQQVYDVARHALTMLEAFESEPRTRAEEA
jgi:hypothetical protein